MGQAVKRLLLRAKLWLHRLRGGGQICCGACVTLHPSVKLAVAGGGELTLGDRCTAAAQSLLLVERDGHLTMGEHVSLSRGVQIVCHDRVEIGDETMLANNVLLFDHDHNVRVPGGLAARVYQKAPIHIGKNVWVGANTVILRGTTIGDNSVVGAGCVLKGEYPSDSVIVQKRETRITAMRGDGHEA